MAGCAAFCTEAFLSCRVGRSEHEFSTRIGLTLTDVVNTGVTDQASEANSEHYDKARVLLDGIDPDSSDYTHNRIAAAQVHALLALRDVLLEGF